MGEENLREEELGLKFPFEFKECPVCRCPDTVCRMVGEEMKKKGKIPKEAFFSMEKTITPLATSALQVASPALLSHYDVCAKCGIRYCTRVDKATMGLQGTGLPPGFNPKGHG